MSPAKVVQRMILTQRCHTEEGAISAALELLTPDRPKRDKSPSPQRVKSERGRESLSQRSRAEGMAEEAHGSWLALNIA